MSEKIVIARHDQTCDLCKHTIHTGEQCRLIRDDFWSNQVWFEHLRCPSGTAVVMPPKPVFHLPQVALAH